MTSQPLEIDVSSYENGTPIEPVGPLKLIGFINDVLQTLLEDPTGNIFDPTESVSDSDSLTLSAFKICSNFAIDHAPMVLFVLKERISSKDDDNSQDAGMYFFFFSIIQIYFTYSNPFYSESDHDDNTYTYRLDTKLSLTQSTVGSIALIKGPSPLNANIPLHSQLQTLALPTLNLNTPSSSPYEALHSMIHFALGPYFEASSQLSAAAHETANATLTSKTYQDKESLGAIPTTRRKIAELELSLLHLQQNIEIPELTLNLHPIIDKALESNTNSEPSIDLIPTEYLSDTDFLNSLQSIVNSWIKSIQGITRMSRDPDSGTAAQEINFWLSMETALKHIENQLQGPGVTLTLNVLRNAKRFHATVSFLSDTGIKEASEKIAKYNQLMKDFPLDELISATTLNGVQKALLLIFGHLNKKLRITPYPVRRALSLVEGISDDLNNSLQSILGGLRLVHLDYTVFNQTVQLVHEIFYTWDEQMKEFTNIAREMTRKRAEKFIPIRISARHLKTKERLDYITSFRIRHQELRETLAKVLGTGTQLEGSIPVGFDGINPLEEISFAYDILKQINVLDISEDGVYNWNRAEKEYNERTTRVENAIIAMLRDRLATAKTSNEMFRVFSKFNALFVRASIRGAIQEYQSRLIDNVKADISALHDRFRQQYSNSEAYEMSKLRDIPPVSGTIIWIRQIERQLDNYMKRVEAVLGKGWQYYAEGQKLHSESVAFRQKLDTSPIYEAWLSSITKKNLSISGFLFKINRTRKNNTNVLIYDLSVNFDPQVIILFKEVRNLSWLNYQVPHTINSVGKDAKRVYPYAVSLIDTLKTLYSTLTVIQEHSKTNALLHGYENNVFDLLTKGLSFTWESFIHVYDLNHDNENRHVKFVNDFGKRVKILESKMQDLIFIYDSISSCLAQLKTSTFNYDSFNVLLQSIQEEVDKLNLEGYVNVNTFVHNLNYEIREILIQRCRDIVTSWISTFDKPDAMQEIAIPNKLSIHELTLKNRVISLHPPLEATRSTWLYNFQENINCACKLPRIQPNRFDIKLTINNKEGGLTKQETFSDIPLAISDDISRIYFLIDYHINSAETYLDNWYQFQALWDLESTHVFDTLGDDMAKWLQILTEIRKARSTFDTTEVYKDFGLLRIDFRTVQVRINAKYDGWQQEIILKFSQSLNSAMKDLCAEIETLRRDLENQSLDSFSTDQVVTTVTKVQYSTNFLAKWESQVSLFRNGQTTLSRYRFRFPSNWLFIDQVDSEWNALKEILSKKSAIIESQIDGIRVRVQAEMKRLTEHIIMLETQWEEDKPIAGSLRPADALMSLAKFENEATSLVESSELLSKAASALELEFNVSSNIVLVIEEIRDFNSVWTALESIWNFLNDLRESPWASVVPRKIRKSLEDLVEVTKGMPTRIRQYAAFEHIQNVLKNLIKSQPIIIDLKTEAIHERHWQKLYKSLAKNKRLFFNSMTLGDVWDMELLANTAFIKDVVTEAQGELALEIFLRQVRQTWTTYNLELTNYKNTCRLIKGWDELFQTCSDHLNSLGAMHHSHYFKVFEEEARGWEEKLNRIHVLFDVWIDVQRQWVYLEGVFNNNAEIKHILPVESSRFQSINSEFFVILRKVYKSPLIIDVLNIPGVQQSIERLADLLGKVQKALGEYYEQERQRFARFYFIGDEDLLEIIGNSNDIHRVEKHLNKMFSGIAGLIYDKENSTIDGVRSREGEEVLFTSNINLIKIPNVVKWLIRLEEETKVTLSNKLFDSINTLTRLISENELSPKKLMVWIQSVPSQISLVTSQILWTRRVEEAMNNKSSLEPVHDSYSNLLKHMASFVLQELSLVDRKKCENLITELIHQRDIISQLISEDVTSSSHFIWQSQLTYHFEPSEPSPTKRLIVTQANTMFTYGFEYLGMPDRLVSTPLVDNFFLAMTQALEQRLGGSPFGPAGTGKTESVKALGQNLGKFVLVFCCDESFDFQAIGRILAGICQVGAWGCFDEFNRLNEQILSAVSMQIEAIELGIKAAVGSKTKSEIELANRNVLLNDETGIFITMNPEYAGRHTLPENLKKLFRSFSMAKPDKEIIAEVLLNSQGFVYAKKLSQIVVPFFTELQNKLSCQVHYDFGLRALKNVLATSGNLKRSRLGVEEKEEDLDKWETSILLQCLRETVAPKLIAEDSQLMLSIEKHLFPNVEYTPFQSVEFETSIRTHALKNGYTASDEWLTKVFQLYQFQKIHHGIMLVGSSGCGKSTVYKSLLSAMQDVENMECIFHLIDAKVMSKEVLFGSLDSTTREWTDGLFTATLRRIVDNLRGEDQKQHWIIFDGDVDPEWAENLNSVLDDNKILTLPNGERISLPNNVRIAFEVENLKYATPATISRCGMIWFGPDVVTANMQLNHFLFKLRQNRYDDVEEDLTSLDIEEIQNAICDHITDIFSQIDLDYILSLSKELDHIMEFTETRALNTVFALINSACLKLLLYLNQNTDYRPTDEQQKSFITKSVLLALVWALAGDCSLSNREEFGLKMLMLPVFAILGIEDSNQVLVDYDVSLPDAKWEKWEDKVPHVSLDTHSIIKTDVVIPTIDTMRHESLIYGLLNAHKPIVLCGPPGSGKTMTLFGALRKLPNLDVVGLNFSKATTPDLLIKSLEQHCEYKKTMKGTILSPSQIGRWLVVFCDEINLPAIDKYGTQTAISLLRQMIEQKGFWSPNQQQWITLSRIQFVGACNPPTDIGRNALNQRFLRHSAVILVDYPGKASLHQIYESFNSAVLKSVPTLRGYASTLTSAMIEFYTRSQERFLSSEQTHYVYSPRELTRWVRGIYEAIHLLDVLLIEGLVRIWAHEALRLFHDRLAKDAERAWTHELLHDVAYKYFLNVDLNTALKMPILYSNWLTKDYLPVDKDELKAFVKARMRTFCEEDLDKPLILYDDLLDHVLRIDRVLRQPQGHLILIGVSGSGKATLSRFVAWMNGIKVVQLKTTRKYSQEEFDADLRHVLKRAGTNGEKICFVLDESNILESAFLERMNTLLANGEVPGLFEGDDYTTLMTACKEGALRQGFNLDSQDELYKWFTGEIVRNLHVIFTMNPPDSDLSSHSVASPALFNRCVLNWMGDWSDHTLLQVASSITDHLDIDRSTFEIPTQLVPVSPSTFPVDSYRTSLVNSMVRTHKYAVEKSKSFSPGEKRNVVSPGDFLDYLNHFVNIFNEKSEELEDQQRHFNVGLDKLKDTVLKVRELKTNLAEKKNQLENKSQEAKEMLRQMISDQSEAERKREASIEIQNALMIQEENIASRQEIVMNDLNQAEPAVIEAQKSVSNIKKQHLTELRSMINPPETVKLALDSVCTLLGYRASTWKEIQGYVRRDDFISNIVNFDSDSQMSPQLRHKMETEFLSLPNFNFETVNRASKACGPLLQWVEAQVTYSSILERVGPLREEVKALQDEAVQTKAQAQAIIDMIEELEASIEKYKEDYAQLITETQAIKSEMVIVENKVNRSVNLLDSLSDERNRWSANIKEFEHRKDSLPGDVLLSSAFISYSGFYDQYIREQMYSVWSNYLSQSGISYQKHNSVSTYLATGEERLKWHNSSLPPDDLCVENAIMLCRYHRYPLIIDPTSRVIPFLVAQHEKKKLTITSFLDDAFIKHLESAIRFGNPILIQDAEYLDPVLTQVLNKEYKRTGGRTLIELGNQDIDFSKDFQLYLLTRDPTVTIAPHISSRTTVVNFTVTRNSLASQALNQVLQAERPEVEEKRLSLIKLHGEYKVHLRQLETNLLQALNESEGNILDHDGIVDTLEKLKVEAVEVTTKVKETDAIMDTIESVMQEYRPLAEHCGKIFAILDKLFLINRFYQFSLEYFLIIFSSVLQENPSEAVDDRVEYLIKKLYQETYRRTSLSLLNKDKPVLLLLLAQAFSPDIDPETLHKVLKEYSIKSVDYHEPGWFSKLENILDEFGSLNSVDLNEKSLTILLEKETPELSIPRLWDESISGMFIYLFLLHFSFTIKLLTTLR